MAEDRSKGISLRKKRTVRPKVSGKEISAPKQISGPMPAGLAAATQSSGGRRPNGPGGPKKLDVPRERPPPAGKTADLVKRRYSQRITTLPNDFAAGAPPLPDMPQIPSQFRQAPPSRDGRPPGSSDGRELKVDMRALRDPNLRPEQC
jgi:exocyst complex component 8